MDAIKVITNNVAREIIYWHELSEKERAEFDYCDEFSQFFRYKGELYHLGEFMAVDHWRECLPDAFRGWDGYQSDSFFSGVLVRYRNNYESVIVGRYFC